MRRVIYSVATSLDGYIAGPNGEFDWIPRDPAVDWGAFMGRFDTVLMGRRTFEVSARQGSGNLPNMRTFVFSRTLKAGEHLNVTIVAEDAASVVSALRDGRGRAIWLMGGGVLFRRLLKAGLVDVVEAGLVPILLGKGIPLLPSLPRPVPLRLTKTKKYPSGILLLTYDVAPASER
jgi:dihydrofolate reductase